MEDFIKIEPKDSLKVSREKINRNFKIVKEGVGALNTKSIQKKYYNATIGLEVGYYYDLGEISDEFPRLPNTMTSDGDSLKVIEGEFTSARSISMPSSTTDVSSIPDSSQIFWAYINCTSVDSGRYYFRVFNNKGIVVKFSS